jgi:hypothetical protein
MTQLILTRYLYNLNEVIHSLLLSILEKESFKETLFWVSELYYSKFYNLLWELLWKIYYDFYAINNPKFEKFITKCNKKWLKKKSINHIIDVVNVLYYNKSINNDVFILRTLEPNLPTKIYRGRNPKWMKAIKHMNLTKKEKVFIRSIDDKNFKNIKFYFNQIKDVDRCYILIKEYFKVKHKLILREKDLSSIPYKNTQHILLAVICYLLTDINNVNKRLIKRKVETDNIEFVKNTDVQTTPVCKLLGQTRLYSINPSVGFFENCRTKNYSELLWYNWEYFTQGCPLWDERFKKLKCTFDKKKYEPIFPNDDILEKFYEQFGLEPDEQSKACQDKSLIVLTDVISYENIGNLVINIKNKQYLPISDYN